MPDQANHRLQSIAPPRLPRREGAQRFADGMVFMNATRRNGISGGVQPQFTDSRRRSVWACAMARTRMATGRPVCARARWSPGRRRRPSRPAAPAHRPARAPCEIVAGAPPAQEACVICCRVMRTAWTICVLALLPTGCEAYVVASPAIGRVSKCAAPALALAPRPRVSTVIADAAADADPSGDVGGGSDAAASDAGAPSPSAFGRARAWFSKYAKFDRKKMQTLGVDFMFTYGVVSNLNVAVTAALAWGVFCRTTGLSPLAPGQVKGYVAAYTTIYLSLGTVLRPVRMAFAVTATPLYARAVAKVRQVLPFRESRPPLNRTLAIILLSILLNVFATGILAALGCSLASLITGVPLLPPRVAA